MTLACGVPGGHEFDGGGPFQGVHAGHCLESWEGHRSDVTKAVWRATV
jgi:hypothetical protein